MNNTNKQVIRLTESQLHDMISEAVNQVLNEIGDTQYGQYMLGRLANRKEKNDPTYGYMDVNRIKSYAQKNNRVPASVEHRWGKETTSFDDGYNDQEDFTNSVYSNDSEKIQNSINNIKDNAKRKYQTMPSQKEKQRREINNYNRKRFSIGTYDK